MAIHCLLDLLNINDSELHALDIFVMRSLLDLLNINDSELH